MAMVFGILGFVMGLTALWFTAEAVRRVDKNGEGLIRPHLPGPGRRASGFPSDLHLQRLTLERPHVLAGNGIPAGRLA
jgi:hypothetical protein